MRLGKVLGIVVVIFGAMMVAKAPAQQKEPTPRYILKDLGTLGGPQSYWQFYAKILTTQGAVAGWADTTVFDPNAPACFNSDCYMTHAFQWQRNVLTDLGAVPGGTNSQATWISETGLVSGVSDNGVTDPLLGTPEQRAVLWSGGQTIDLGTLGGNESVATSVNSGGLVAGVAANTAPDDFSLLGWGTQVRGFAWQNGVMTDIGTLGGPDTLALTENESGQVTGCSYTNNIPNSTTGIPTIDPMLWQNGKMTDLGTLGGVLGCANYLNSKGQVVGYSDLAGDLESHPFLWDGKVMTDLGTFGGSSGEATRISDTGVVIGSASRPGDLIFRAFVWQNGVLKDIGVVPGDKCAKAWGINSKGQVVGASGDCNVPVHAFLWEKGQMIDLTRLMPPGVQLTYGIDINERGQIAAYGRVPGNGDSGVLHAFLLVPIGDGADPVGQTSEKRTSGLARIGGRVRSTDAHH